MFDVKNAISKVAKILKIKKTDILANKLKLATAFLTACTLLSTFCFAMQCNNAVAICVNDVRVGTVADAEAAKAVEKSVRANVKGNIEGIIDFSYSEELAFGRSFDSTDELANEILSSCDELNRVFGLFVDQNLTAYSDSSAEIVESLEALVETYTVEGAVFKGYANEVMIKETFVTDEGLKSLVSSAEGFLEGKCGVEIITSRVESYDEEIPYDTKVTYDETRTAGYLKVVNKGKNGLSHVTADVIYINGNRSGADVITSELITPPVDAKVKKGLCDEAIESIRISHSNSSVDSQTKLFTFPCEITERTYISSYWGDGRNHMGIDIASKKGSEIYAAADGVVSFAGVNGAYGNCVIISHPDGKTKTLYAHNSSNLVKKGDTVKEGQVIAKVGSTGRSTGNHLHFSVLVNGKQVNPEKYLGLK